MIIIGTDPQGKVLMVTEASDVSAMPTDFNGVTIKPYALTADQVTAYRALPNRKSLTFDGTTFTAVPADPPAVVDLSDPANQAKAITALGMCIAQVGGLTNPQMKALFASKWNSLP